MNPAKRFLATLLALIALMMLALGWQTSRLHDASANAGPENPATAALTAVVVTDWLPPDQARTELERHSRTVEQLARAHRAEARLLAAQAKMQTRASTGVRLRVPLLRFEHRYEIQLKNPDAAAKLREQLLAADIQTSAERTRLARRNVRAVTTEARSDF